MIVENKAGGGGSIGATETDPCHAGRLRARHGDRVSTTAANPAINPKIALQPADRLHADHQRRGHART